MSRSEDLALLADDDLVVIHDALAVVRLGTTLVANVRGELTDLVLVRAAHDDVAVLLDVELDSVGGVRSTGWQYPTLSRI